MKLLDKLKYIFSLEWIDFQSMIEAAIHTDMWTNGYTDQEIDEAIQKYRDARDVK